MLRSLTNSKSMRRTAIITDALQYIKQLILKVETLNKEYDSQSNSQLQVSTEVKVEKIEKGFLVHVSCEKGRDSLVTILETLEEMGLNVLQARVSCNKSFWMEAIGEDESQSLDVRLVKLAILNALEKKVGRMVQQ